jgi:hypothetical protein
MFKKILKGLFGGETEVNGRITSKEYAGVVTLYDITDKDQKIYKGALLGHQESPEMGDDVVLYLSEGTFNLAARMDQIPNQREDGSIGLTQKRVGWKEITRYRVLEKENTSQV